MCDRTPWVCMGGKSLRVYAETSRFLVDGYSRFEQCQACLEFPFFRRRPSLQFRALFNLRGYDQQLSNREEGQHR
ncbi:MAG: hypothetical protein VXZ15_06140, partial [Planctomycetota bacterium]|nr:hypothetical protein [Planctomycetota bacterium]